MTDRLTRTAILYGRENVERLKSRRVAVFGLGGVGGHCAESLCRTGVGALDLFDGDIVDITNINRQIIATHKTVGRDKVDVMRERLLEIAPDAEIRVKKLFYLPGNADAVDLSVFDYIIDAVDTIAAKLEIVCRATELGVPVISAMGAANKLDPTAFEVADIYETSVCPIARIMRGELRKRGVAKLKVVYSKEPPVAHGRVSVGGSGGSRPNAALRDEPASNAFVPPVAGLIIASEAIRDLTGI